MLAESSLAADALSEGDAALARLVVVLMAKDDGAKRAVTCANVLHKSWYRLLQISKKKKRSQRLKKDKGVTNDDEGAGEMAIPEHLVETILSRIPYPHVFKTRLLSKQWYAKFPVDDGDENFPTPFQETIKSSSTMWPSFCPVYLNPAGSLIGFNSTTKSWQVISVSASVPSILFYPNARRERRLYFGGSLLAILDCGICQRPTADHHLFVMNIQSGSWREIAVSEDRRLGINTYLLLINEVGMDGYKVLVNQYYNSSSSPFKTDVYESNSAGSSWTTSNYRSEFTNSPTEFSEYCLYHDGNLFCMEPEGKVGPIELVDLVDPEVVRLWKFNLKMGVWTESAHTIQLHGKAWSVGGVFRCGSRLMLAVIHEEPEIETEIETDIDDIEESWEYIDSLNLRPRARIYEINAERLDFVEVSISPLDIYPGSILMSDRHCIYFAHVLYNRTSVACYNIRDDTWSRLPSPPPDFCRSPNRALRRPFNPWARSAYEPGVNPFAST